MNKEKVTKEILDILWKCENILSSKPTSAQRTETSIAGRVNEIANSHCGSWLGYHSRIYYKGFQAVPAGAHFDIEWGFYRAISNGTTGEWEEYDFAAVKDFVCSNISEEDEKLLVDSCKVADANADEVKLLFETLLDVLLEDNKSRFFEDIKAKLDNVKVHVAQSDFASALNPRRQYMTRDSTALSQGVLVPPHIQLQSWLMSLTSPFHAIEDILSLAKKSLNYMKLNDILERKDIMPGSKIFIGHGGSLLWRELKDFIKDRLHLQWDEFNRETAAGKTTIERLNEMLEASSFAFLIMTGEDEHSDKSIHARENVVHEVGLFQGKLGFRKAIVLLEDGCEEFSNITGLSQIRFPKGKISASFEEIRQVLEREGLI